MIPPPMAMHTKVMIALGLLLPFALGSASAEDYLREAQGEDSPLVKMSSSHHVRVTILYVGPMKEKFIDYVFAITYMAEDLGSDEQYERNNTADPPAPNHLSKYDIFPAALEVKDGNHQVVGHPGGNWMTYKEALSPDFKARYPMVTLPSVDHPARARIFQCFYKSILTGPFEITLHEYIPAFGENSFDFRDIDVAAFASP